MTDGQTIAEAGGSTPAFICQFTPEWYQRGSTTSLFVTVTYQLKTDADFRMSLYGTPGVQFPGDSVWHLSTGESGGVAHRFDVKLPEHDTGAIGLTFDWDGQTETHKYWFVTSGDSAEFWKRDPREIGRRVDFSGSDASSQQDFDWKNHALPGDTIDANRQGFKESASDRATANREPMGPMGLLVEMIPASLPRDGGRNTLALVIHPQEWPDSCHEVNVSIDTLDNLAYVGPKSLHVPIRDGKVLPYSLTVDVPPGDTSGIAVSSTCCGAYGFGCAYFVSSADTTRLYHDNPRLLRELPHRGQIELPDRPLTPAEQERQLLYKPEYVMGSEIRSAFQVPNTWDTIGDPRGPMTMDRLHELEQNRLVGQQQQAFVINGEHWQRLRGDKLFRKMVFQTAEEMRALGLKSVQNAAVDKSAPDPVRDSILDLILDLRDTTLLNWAKQYVDSLWPMEQSGYYRVRVPRHVRNSLRSRIDFAPYPEYPPPVGDTAGGGYDSEFRKHLRPPPGEIESFGASRSPNTIDTLFKEDFEFSFANGERHYEYEENETYRVGRLVTHPTFGRGKIVRADGFGDSLRLEIMFTGIGVKKIMAKFAKLKVVG